MKEQEPAGSAEQTTDSPVCTITKEQYFNIQSSSNAGLGIFASTLIPAGTVVLHERPLVQGLPAYGEWMVESMKQEERTRYYELFAYDKLGDTQAARIFRSNQYRLPSGEGGVYYIASRLNHSHNANLRWHFIEADPDNVEIVFVSRRDIQVGEELLVNYGHTPESLYINYGFFCGCGHCEGYTQAQADVIEQKVQLQQQKLRNRFIDACFDIERNSARRLDVDVGWRKQGCW